MLIFKFKFVIVLKIIQLYFFIMIMNNKKKLFIFFIDTFKLLLDKKQLIKQNKSLLFTLIII